MNKTVLLLAVIITIAGIYFVVFEEEEPIPLVGDLKPASNTTSLGDNKIEFILLSNSGQDIFIMDIAGDCNIIPPPIAIKRRSSFRFTGECNKALVYRDNTVDLVFTYKIKGENEKKQQAIKLYV